MNFDSTLTTDVLIIGGGGAALRAAIEAYKHDVNVLIVDKGTLGYSGSTATAKAELILFAAVQDKLDSINSHVKDTLIAGAGFANEKLVKVLAKEAPLRLKELESFGVEFEKDDGKFKCVKGFAHSFPRCRVLKGRSEEGILFALMKEIKMLGIPYLENTMITHILQTEGRIAGAIGINSEGNFLLIHAKSIILACGGGGQAYLHNVYQPIMTGDGYVLAFEAGAKLANMKFIQMGPGLIYPAYLIFSAPMWKLIPRLYNGKSEEFLDKYIPFKVDTSKLISEKEFPFNPKSLTKYVDIAIYSEILKGNTSPHGGIYYDITHKSYDEIQELAPYTYSRLKQLGLDPLKQPLEIGIVVQCFLGGIIIDEKSQTNVQGLFACGEVATGAHGEQRPGGNSLAECQVFGARAGRFAAEFSKKHSRSIIIKDNEKIKIEKLLKLFKKESKFNPNEIKREIQEIMFYNVGIVKSIKSLYKAKEELEKIEFKKFPYIKINDKNELVSALSVKNLLTTAKFIVNSALSS